MKEPDVGFHVADVTGSDSAAEGDASIAAISGADSAFFLLRLEQRLEACDRLFNEEITGMRKELARLTAVYVRAYQAATKATDCKSQLRTGRAL